MRRYVVKRNSDSPAVSLRLPPSGKLEGVHRRFFMTTGIEPSDSMPACNSLGRLTLPLSHPCRHLLRLDCRSDNTGQAPDPLIDRLGGHYGEGQPEGVFSAAVNVG